ncbi:erythromycin esterase family protein [Streptomyces sp. PSKA30]|uniref:erythromycin esterase family protein n=1 Tax=Streptomyces sp. PSKA30 TaxID=2874597 RepID=UPI001CD17FF8|nr:erythromycin esterase family protein [Streptomyces sp. PSKA30]MBZ9645618.1 erythromycin esterase family protein [Streptomyces sp. PSKA30]
MVNVGQLVRERNGADDVVLVGFGSFEGTVMAADFWGARLRVMRVPPARDRSLEHRLHQALPRQQALFVFPPDDRPAGQAEEGRPWFQQEHDHRAIGVVHRPARERRGNYVPTCLADRYDAFCHLDHTTALTPLHPERPGAGEEEETRPSGM